MEKGLLNLNLKGHSNEADFLGALQKLVPHRSLTPPFEPFHFWLQICGYIRNKKTTQWVGDSLTRGVRESGTLRLGEPGSRWLSHSAFECLKENSESRHGKSGSRHSNFLKFSIDFPNFKPLNQLFKRSIWQKRSQGYNVLSPLIYLKVWKKLYL